MTKLARSATPETLSSLVEFDAPFEVTEDGQVIPHLPHSEALYAPDVYDGELLGDKWKPVCGYSGQYGTKRGDFIMHNSEYLGGGMARDVLASPGVYCLVIARWEAEEGEEDEGPIDEGWVLVKTAGSAAEYGMP